MCGSGGKVVIRAEAGVPGAEQGQSSEGLEGDVPGLVPPLLLPALRELPLGRETRSLWGRGSEAGVPRMEGGS